MREYRTRKWLRKTQVRFFLLVLALIALPLYFLRKKDLSILVALPLAGLPIIYT